MKVLLFFILLPFCFYNTAIAQEPTEDELGFAFIENKQGKTASPGFIQNEVYKSNPEYKEAKKVFDRLVEARGDFRMRTPSFVLSDAERQVAIAKPRKAEITLERKAYEVCRSLGKDSLHALAALLSHELIHYYEKHDWTNHFARQHRQTNTGIQLRNLDEALKLETQADYLGGLLAYSAGYQTLDIMPRLLDAIYLEYGLTENITGYPSLEERKTIANQSLKKLQRLIYVFETSKYLTALEQYETAKQYLEFILKDFQSRTLYNNLGLITSHAAMTHMNSSDIEFAFPLEFDGTSRLTKKIKKKNALNTDAEDLLRQAIRYFEQAHQLDKAYPVVLLNLACVHTLLKEYEDAEFYIRRAQKLCNADKWKKTQTDIVILQGIISAQQGKTEEAAKLFEEASEAGNHLAALNLKSLNKELIHPQTMTSRGFTRPLPLDEFNIDQTVVQFLKGDFTPDETVAINKQIRCDFLSKAKSTIYGHIINQDQYSFFQISKSEVPALSSDHDDQGGTYPQILQQYGTPDRVLESVDGSILVYYAQKLLFELDENRKVKAHGTFRLKNIF